MRLDVAGAERGVFFGGALFGALLFGAALGARGPRDPLCGVGSTDSIAAIRSAWVMPDMSTAGGTALGGGFEPAALAEGGADRSGAVDAGATIFAPADVELPPFVAVGGGAGLVRTAATGASRCGALSLVDGTAEGAPAIDSGVASGARRTT